MDVSSGRGSVRVCQRCGKEYQAGGYKFCSRECMLGTGICKKCGKAFQCEHVGQKKCRACQGHAQERACPECGKVVSLQAHRTYCSKACYEQARARVPDHCPVCGVDVPKGRKYCTKECRDKALAHMVVCAVCGKEFKGGIHHNQRQKFCSQECAWQAQKRREDRVCLQCGKAFHPHSRAKGLYCSHQCAGLAMKKKRAPCAYCGKDHIADEGAYCSKGCEKAAYREGFGGQFDDMAEWMGWLSRTFADMRECELCGDMFRARRDNTRWCPQCRRYLRNRHHELRIYRNGKPDLSITLWKVYQRDKGYCRGCGRHLEFVEDYNSDVYPSIDHIVPLAKGGLHRWDNVQLMCRGCNSLKCDEEPAVRERSFQTRLAVDG